MIDTGIILTYIMIGICVAAIVGFAVSKVFTHFSKVKNALIGIAVLLVIFLIGYSIADGSDYVNYPASMGITEAKSKMVGTGLTTFYVLALLSVLSILYVEVSKIFK
ncbi:hypothetical protein JCM31826_14350 [Thermaurantimonas aggregans]|uniref:Uncharacterized protein n=1 Tax=Thermaurantimonas aggregans TaxID=2173829 RepID=A0A401XLS0_9FLAO|nr:hypothetical protein [Thermaurantimonas aggregans]MCX8147797.1 hypothetical protein [Thermaurantimonas aggregans]GCD77953.1 hypothetical protein JCM31826_14350 [Thermaurantimonas aggregans]